MSAFRDFQVGAKVRLSGKFLRATGQVTGSEGSKTWTIRGICQGGAWAIVDEPSMTNYFTPEELEADPTLKWRRIAVANLVIVGQRDSRNSP
jgi:hypothetical protein